tara:strand:+ start:2224 stop:2991 length:768 start_codon:yes stop_codon:yes gene_type:complete
MPYVFAASAAGALPQIALTNSQTWVPPQDGNICIHVIGAGGGGKGHAIKSGGAGGYCKKNSLAVTTSGSYTVVIGTGGAGGQNGNGGDGGNTTFAGTGLGSTLTANGGVGATSSNGTGGTASNGDVNNTGGAGGDYEGGAVGIYGTGSGGGDSSGWYAASTDALAWPGFSGFGHICGERGGYSPGYFTGTSNGPTAEHGGFLSGGQGVYGGFNMSYLYGGNGGIGGGGGGAQSQGSGYSRGGMGGDGMVLIQYLP